MNYILDICLVILGFVLGYLAGRIRAGESEEEW